MSSPPPTKSRKQDPPPGAIRVALTNDEKTWLETYLDRWAGRRGTKGQTKGSAMEFVRTDILEPYLNRFHSHRSSKERKLMGFHSTNTIYFYLRGISDRKTGTGSKDVKRIDVVNLWAKHSENAESVDSLFAAYRKEHNLPPTASIPLDERRIITCDAFHKLPEEVQSRYRDIAAGLKHENRKNQPLEGEARIDYAKSFVSELLHFIRRAEEKAGIIVVANVAYEVSIEGALKVTSVSTNSGKSYKKTDAHVDSMVGFGEWLRQAESREVRREKPLPAVYPDRQNENMPLIPQLPEPPVVTIGRNFIRDYITAMWQRLHGGGPVPWRAMYTSWAKGEHRFVEPHRLPPGCPPIDPFQMISEQVNIWIEWLSRPQLGIDDESSWFGFKMVYTSNLKALPESSAAIQKSETRRNTAKVWELEYNGWVKNCQVGGKIQYSAESLQYEEYLVTQGLTLAAQNQPHWLGLPPRTPSNTQPAIPETARDFVLGLLANVTETDKHIVGGLIDSLNEMYSLMPAEKSNGLWANEDDSVIQKLGLPALLPSSLDTLPEPMEYLTEFWLTNDYFRPPFEVDENATHGWFETWQHRLLKNGLLHHSESGTLLGGQNGIRWAALVIIKHLLNVGAVKGKLVSPVPQPEGLSVRRLSEGLWDLSLEWCETWTAEIKSTISILRQTYEERFAQPISAALAAPLSDHDDGFDESSDAPDPVPDTPVAGPSRILRPRDAYIPKIDLPVSDDENGSDHSQLPSDEESDGDDAFKLSDGEDQEDDDESDDEGGQISAKAKGKQAVPSRPVVEDVRKKFMAKYVRSGSAIDRVNYEISQELSNDEDPVRTNAAPGPLADIPLNSHPFGSVIRPAPLNDWKGRVAELKDECKGIIAEARAALLAIQESSHAPYSDEDDESAQRMAEDLGSIALPLLAIVCKHRIVWNRAKDAWPTIQYQLKVFEDLMKRSFQVLPILHTCVGSSPPEVTPSLTVLLKKLERVSFRVRFVYQELHDLGVLSAKYFELLESGWDNPSHTLDFPALQSTVAHIFQWSKDTEAVLEWHQNSRQKTWERRNEDPNESPIPLGTSYRFGNPGPQEKSDEVFDWLRRDSPNTDDSEDHGDQRELHIDEQSPGADDERARALLEGDDDGGSDPAATLDEALAREQGLQGNDIPPEPKVPGTSTVSSRGKKKGADVNKRKRSFGGEQPNPDHSLKKKKVGKGTGVKAAIKPGAKDAGEGGSSDKTTRAGRVVKPSTKARG